MEEATHNRNKKMKAGEESADSEGTTGNSTSSKQSSAIHDLGSNSTKSQSASASADPKAGCKETNISMRSVLMHPICLPLVIALNDVQKLKNADADANQIPAYVSTAFARFRSNDDNTERKNVFAATALNWGDGETDFTKKLVLNIDCCKIEESLLVTEGEKEIGRAINEIGKVDVICHKKNIESVTSCTTTTTTTTDNSSSKSSVVALFEFGLGHEKWWAKQDQILKYVKTLCTNKDKNYKIDQPVLLSVITINKNSQSKDKNIMKWKGGDEVNKKEYIAMLKSNLKRIEENETYIKNYPFEARFGVFLCIRKSNDNFRIALLWRNDTKTLRDASTQFGKVLYAVELCSHLSEPTYLKEMTKQYKYLGPNCCKIGDLVRCTFYA